MKLKIIIPAIKKDALIPDQLIRKLNGITLIERVIDYTIKYFGKKNILLLTDSEEISVLSNRLNLDSIYDVNIEKNCDIISYINNNKIFGNCHYLIKYPDTLLINQELFSKIIDFYKTSCLGEKLLKTFCRSSDVYRTNSLDVPHDNEYYKYIKSVCIFEKNNNITDQSYSVIPYIFENGDFIQIDSYNSLWVCEKLLNRKRIVFNVIGNSLIGTGHIYRSLSIAHEIKDHDVIFICDKKYDLAVKKIASKDYCVLSSDDVLTDIVRIRPDLVVNDTLDTDFNFIKTLKANTIKVVSFEDFGSGASLCDFVVNELFDEPLNKNTNILWGHKYMVLRDEFDNASPNLFNDTVKSLLITFGGSDPNNLTCKSLHHLKDLLITNNVKVKVVIGSGYKFIDEFNHLCEDLLNKGLNLQVFNSVEMISPIMENTDLALCSNGRTIYELAYMNIPSVVISHHSRENTHTFSSLKNGFINLGIFNEEIFSELKSSILNLFQNNYYRYLLYLNMEKISFHGNKKNLVYKIENLLK